MICADGPPTPMGVDPEDRSIQVHCDFFEALLDEAIGLNIAPLVDVYLHEFDHSSLDPHSRIEKNLLRAIATGCNQTIVQLFVSRVPGWTLAKPVVEEIVEERIAEEGNGADWGWLLTKIESARDRWYSYGQ